ncbi:hypothetical protein EGI31_01780 [Lacihabitans soyangensis]|uniref:Uncharacterized protein n=2 Tax=Lacihabitans soyangensis TaxID=869394 RepID=A0AAE3H088_9BACT|nr:hypothetical protein [Lacihabitans soyangensis]
MFFSMVLLANFFFFEKIEPAEHGYFYDKLLSLFLFQFDYFLLFAYISFKTIKFPIRPLFLLSFVYACLFVMGMSSIIITDEKEFDIYYSYLQPVFRLIFIIVFYLIGFEKSKKKSRKNTALIVIGLVLGLYFLFLLNSYPRPTMWQFNFYWLVLMSFYISGIFVKFTDSRNAFLAGVLFVFLSDLYYILPPEARMYELTYILIRIINTLGEFLIVKCILEHYVGVKKV